MIVEYKGNELSEKDREMVWDILCECDEEFYPKLSARNSSSQKNLKDTGVSGTAEMPIVYYEEMIQQDFLLAYEDNEVVGFMTFKKNYECYALSSFGKSLYITTVCVNKKKRGQGIMKALYCAMEKEVTKICECNRISTRTWSLNTAQTHELSKRGYQTISVLENDRGPGVDTIYFGLVV